MSAPPGGTLIHPTHASTASRYTLLFRIASGGMATVFVGRLSSSIGVSRLFAIKRPHPHIIEDPGFLRMLVAEADVASRIHHANVVAVQSIERLEGELLLVMDYVEGASVAELCRKLNDPRLPAPVAFRILLDACAGLHAAHQIEDDDGRLLGVVHRDISPHNILVGVDGSARVTDFGIAKIATAHRATRTGTIFGKAAYMAPEYIESGNVDLRGDIFALGVVAWELLTGQRLFQGPNEFASLRLVKEGVVPSVRDFVPSLPRGIDEVLARALEKKPCGRYASAEQFASELESYARDHGLVASHADVGARVKLAVGTELARRRAILSEHLDSSPIRTAGRNAETAALGGEPPSAADRASPLREPTLLMSVLTVRDSEPMQIPGLARPSRARALSRGAVVLLAAASLGAVAVVRARSPAAPVSTSTGTSIALAPAALPDSAAATSASVLPLAREKSTLEGSGAGRYSGPPEHPRALSAGTLSSPVGLLPQATMPARTRRTRDPARAGAPASTLVAVPSAQKTPPPPAAPAVAKPPPPPLDDGRDKAPPNPYEE